jgi:hypothetical protein
MNKKEIKPGDYWIVSYKDRSKVRSYKGVVLVKERSDYDNGWSCMLPDANKYRNSLLDGALFRESDFTLPSTQSKFLQAREVFLSKELKRCQKLLEQERRKTIKKKTKKKGLGK